MSSHNSVTKFFGNFLANILYKYPVIPDEDKASDTLGAHNFTVVTYSSLLGAQLSETHTQLAVCTSTAVSCHR